jgi:hypothetical protein
LEKNKFHEEELGEIRLINSGGTRLDDSWMNTGIVGLDSYFDSGKGSISRSGITYKRSLYVKPSFITSSRNDFMFDRLLKEIVWASGGLIPK